MIDWSHVQQLCLEVGAEDFDEVVELFFEEVEDTLSRLEERNDTASLAADMHFLKGSALSLGFSEMSQLCHAAEKSAENGASDGVNIGAILQVYSASKQEFLADYRVKLAA
ncbi:Hpt domain-containing protein [Sulfitobacter pacificus]|uniref:Nickel transporter n=1 Tax=Sulfitobacter pacificus TaxID=1499314 RepID=A0ABQ5VMB3_9RHOB|nr:Hpt domain-containing protein [Sulfitobacter pacificus]GLQ28293.1 nickel transporter [Sulfitobacter pacificus]